MDIPIEHIVLKKWSSYSERRTSGIHGWKDHPSRRRLPRKPWQGLPGSWWQGRLWLWVKSKGLSQRVKNIVVLHMYVCMYGVRNPSLRNLQMGLDQNWVRWLILKINQNLWFPRFKILSHSHLKDGNDIFSFPRAFFSWKQIFYFAAQMLS